MNIRNPVFDIYIKAYITLSEDPEYSKEIDWVNNIDPLEKQTPESFEFQYIWVVLNSGLKEQVARKIFNRFYEQLNKDFITESPLDIIKHEGKRKAILDFALYGIEKRFEELKSAENKIEYLKTLPWIGDITKYHLARNIGIDCVKPDRHLQRLSSYYGFESPYKMCIYIRDEVDKIYPSLEPTKLGLIDLVLWRWCNLGRWNDD